MMLSLRRAGSADPISFEAHTLVVAGFTGSNQDAVAAHVEELGRLGVPKPTETPTLYPLDISLLTSDTRITVSSRETSGEVEPVLFCVNGDRYIGVGSDHTARDLEHIDIGQSKAACPKIIGTDVIDYQLAVDQWHALQLRARTAGGRLYQDGTASELLAIPELLDYMRARGVAPVDGTVIFLGTLPLKGEEFIYSDHWSLELAVPDGPTLTCSYGVEVTSEPEVLT